jgi:hypothetical protein
MTLSAAGVRLKKILGQAAMDMVQFVQVLLLAAEDARN